MKIIALARVMTLLALQFTRPGLVPAATKLGETVKPSISPPPITSNKNATTTLKYPTPTIQIRATARGYTDCGIIASSGYVSSYSVMRFYSHADQGEERMFSKKQDMQYDRELTRNSTARELKTLRYDIHSGPAYFQRAAVVSPPQTPQAPAAPTRLHTPFKRIMPDNPYACAVGSVTVSPVVPGAIPQPGDVVTLQVTSFVGSGRGTWDYVEDTYRLPTAGNKPVTFDNVAVQAIRTSKDAQQWRDLFDEFKQYRSSGTLIGLSAFYNLNAPVRLACIISAPNNRTAMGTISCPPGLHWPTY